MKALVLGAGGFIGSHMVDRLKSEGYWVRAVDLKVPDFEESHADDFVIADLRIRDVFNSLLSLGDGQYFDEVYQFAADMGGAGYIFTGEHDADIMHNSASINLNLLDSVVSRITKEHYPKIFYSSSACMYPEHNQLDPDNPNLAEASAYPANPDSEYGWEKLFSERLFQAFNKNYGIPVAIARFHNIYGPKGTWRGGKEKAPAAICRKIAMLAPQGGEIEVWGDGLQTRSFLFIDECIEAVRRLMNSHFEEPINIGSEEMVTVNQLVETVADVSGKNVTRIHNLDAPVGVRGRNSDNNMIREVLNWDYKTSLKEGVALTYRWIVSQLEKEK